MPAKTKGRKRKLRHGDWIPEAARPGEPSMFHLDPDCTASTYTPGGSFECASCYPPMPRTPFEHKALVKDLVPGPDDAAPPNRSNPGGGGRKQHRPNKYAGKCPKCNGWVEAMAGKLVKVKGKWGAEHLDACPPPKARKPEPTFQVTLPAGHYATPHKAGTGITFFKVDRPEEGKWSGWVFVKHVVGGKPDSRAGSQRPGAGYRGQIQAAIEAAQANPDAAALLYRRELERCTRCNRHLTEKDSRDLAMGPVCRTK